jgi:hypothetical protein
MELSPRATENLKRFLQRDYDCIAKLHEMGKIDRARFTALMGYTDIT